MGHSGMRVRFILCSLILVVFILPTGTVHPSPPVVLGRTGSILSGDPLEIAVGLCDPRIGGACTFTVLVRDPSLLFFRWNVTTSPGWDYPVQTGGPGGTWTTDNAVTVSYRSDAPRRVCVQGWDGVSTMEVNGVVVPDGPIDCASVLLDASLVIRPNRWSANSEGRWVTAFLTLPSDVDSVGIGSRSVEVNGVRAVAWPAASAPKNPSAGGWDWMFKVDRGSLTNLQAPGVHTMYLRGDWGTGMVIAADDVEIL